MEIACCEDIKIRHAAPEGYFDGRKCCVCGNEKTGKNNNSNPLWYKYYDKKGLWDKKSWLCSRCYFKFYKRLPGSVLNVDAKWRKGLLELNDSSAKGIIGEAVVAKVRRLEILSVNMDSLRYLYDLSKDREYGIFQVKFRIFLERRNKWNIRTEISQNYDNLIILCADKEMNNIERVYIIPKKELYGMAYFTVYKNPSRGVQWYEKFRINDIDKYDKVYHNLIGYLKDKKYFGIEDIKKWLE